MSRRSSRQRREMQGQVRVVVVVVRNLAVSIVTKGGVGVLKIRGVRRVRGGEGVAHRNCLFHVELSIFASRHNFFILDLGLTTFWFFFLSFFSEFQTRREQKPKFDWV